MRVLVDTPVWSFALRRRHPGERPSESRGLEEWRRLTRESRAVLCGPVRMEVLAGVPDEAAFARIRERLRWFPDEAILREDYEEAARAWTACARSGVAATSPDMVLCALAMRLALPILTTDRDFERYARVIPIRLHAPR